MVQNVTAGLGKHISTEDTHSNRRLLEEETLAAALSGGPGREKKQGGGGQEKRRLNSTPVTDQVVPPSFVPLRH